MISIMIHTWYGLICLLISSYYVINWLYELYLCYQLQCKHIQSQDDDYVFGIYNVIRLLRVGPNGGMLDGAKGRLEQAPKGTFAIRLIGSRIVFTKNSENIKAILSGQFHDYGLFDRFKHFRPFLGKSIFTLDGVAWKDTRALIRPQFAREQVAHVQGLEPHIQDLAKHIRKEQGKPFDIQKYFNKFTYDTATEFLFGESLKCLQDETIGYSPNEDELDRQTFDKAIAVAAVVSSFRAFTQGLYWLVNPKIYRDSCATIHEFTGRQVNKALALTPEELDKKSQGGYFILYELVKVTRDPTIIGEQLLSLFLAGRYTTAGTLSFIYFELGRRPEIFEKLKLEIYQTFGSGDDCRIEDITFESLKKCLYLKAVINESLRVWPVVPQNSRVATKNTTLPRGGGKHGLDPVLIRKGQTVVWSTYSIHRDQEIYGEDCNLFRPERWLDSKLAKLGWVYMPFGGGPRICLGQQFALTEAAYTLVRLVQLFPNLKGAPCDYPPPVRVSMGLSLVSSDVIME